VDKLHCGLGLVLMDRWADHVKLVSLELMGYQTPNTNSVAIEGRKFIRCYAERSCTVVPSLASRGDVASCRFL
jgi:arylsulfatase A-like enzyme